MSELPKSLEPAQTPDVLTPPRSSKQWFWWVFIILLVAGLGVWWVLRPKATTAPAPTVNTANVVTTSAVPTEDTASTINTDTPPLSTAVTVSTDLTRDTLLNGTYNTVTYANGTKTTVSKTGMDAGMTFVYSIDQDHITFGDLNNDQAPDAVVITTNYSYPTGGNDLEAKTAKRHLLNAVVNEGGKPKFPVEAVADMHYDLSLSQNTPMSVDLVEIKKDGSINVNVSVIESNYTLIYKLMGGDLVLQSTELSS